MMLAATILSVVAFAVTLVWVLAWNIGTAAHCTMRCPEDGQLYTYRVKLYHWLPRLTPWHEVAITLGDQVFCIGDCPRRLHAHEFYHVKVNRQYGKVERFVRYLRDLASYGYWRHPEEQAARAYADRNAGAFAHLI